MCSTFKDFVEDDLSDVFLNLEEFGEYKKIGYPGTQPQEFLVVVDNDLLKERSAVKDGVENIFVGDVLFFVRKEELGFVPAVGKTLVFDGKLYIVSSSNDDNGLLEVVLISNNG